MSLAIYRLCERPQWAETCHAWDEAAWPRTPEIATFFASHYDEAARNKENELPQTFVAAWDGNPVGMMSVIEDDHPDLLELKPWLASAYVLPEYRGKGIFRALHDVVLDFTRRAGFSVLHVYSPIDFTRLGWQAWGQTHDPFAPDQKVTIYRYDFTTKPS